MPWADAVAGPLRGATCLWQDLDGAPVGAAPEPVPPPAVLGGRGGGGRPGRGRPGGRRAVRAKALRAGPPGRRDSGAADVLEGWLRPPAWLRPELPRSVLTAYGKLRLGHVTCPVTGIPPQPASHAEIAAGPPLRQADLA